MPNIEIKVRDNMSEFEKLQEEIRDLKHDILFIEEGIAENEWKMKVAKSEIEKLSKRREKLKVLLKECESKLDKISFQ